MRTSFCAVAACCLAFSGVVLRATGPQTGPPTGRVLILKNDRALEGDIVRQGDQYVIRRDVGEITVPVVRAKKMCADWEEAIAFIRSQANLRDPDERLRLAKWCQQHGLKKHALAESAAAVELRPGHAESQRLLKYLQNEEKSPSASEVPVSQKAAWTTPLQVDLNSESLALFTTRVQPILMNACANCHCNERGGSFHLQRVSSTSTNNRTATQHNLTEVLRRVDLERPAMSILLIKALSDHAGVGQAPIKKKDSPVYHNLEGWLHSALASNPHLREIPELRRSSAPIVGKAVPDSPPMATPAVHTSDKAGFAVAPPPSLPSEPVPATPPAATISGDARPVPTIASPTPVQQARPLDSRATPTAAPDEFDPAEFNKRAQPPRQ